MKGMIIVGALLIALGVAAYMGVLDFKQREEVLKIGDLKATVEREKTVPQWAGLVAIIAGGVLVVAGVVKKR